MQQAELYTLIMKFSSYDIAAVINDIGAESIAGFSNVEPQEVEDVLELCDTWELADILAWLQSGRYAPVYY